MEKKNNSSIIPESWKPPCFLKCTKKYAALKQIPWRVYCKKGCSTDADTWQECMEECDGLCYKDPVYKDHQWSAYIDRSPGNDSYSAECFHACVAGCGYKFGIAQEEIDGVHPKRPPKPPTEKKPRPPIVEKMPTAEEMVSNSA